MRSFKLMLACIALVFVTVFAVPTTVSAQTQTAADCGKNARLFGIIPTWYRYLTFDRNCEIHITTKVAKTNVNGETTVYTDVNFREVWLITFAVIDMLLTLAGLAATVYVIYGGYQFVMAQGSPDRIAKARNTVFNALIGVVIAIIASGSVSFIVNLFVK